MLVMESFFKSFEILQALLKPIANSEKRFIIRRRSGGELFGAGFVYLSLVAVLFQISLNGYPLTAVLLLLAVSLVTIMYVRDVDLLELKSNGDLVMASGWPGLKKRQTIARSSIQFIGVGIGEKVPASGKPHLVYIQHDERITAVQHKRIGREAVVLAKQIRSFVGM